MVPSELVGIWSFEQKTAIEFSVIEEQKLFLLASNNSLEMALYLIA
jgi:hypothetical protein